MQDNLLNVNADQVPKEWNLPREIAIAVALGALALSLNYLFWIRGNFGGFGNILLHEADQMAYATLARNITQGHGLIDSCIYPVSFSGVPHIPHPYLRGTLFPIMLVPFFLLFGATDLWAIVPVWFCYGLLVSVSYLLARRFFALRLSLLAALLIALDPTILGLSTRPLPDLPATVALAALMLALFGNVRPLILGLLWGGTYYIRPTSLFFLPAFLFLLPTKPSRWKERLHAWCGFFLGWLIVFCPWMIRNALLTGNPFYNYLKTDIFTYARSFQKVDAWNIVHPPDPVRFALTHPGEIYEKIGVVLGTLYEPCRPPAMWFLVFTIPLSYAFICDNRRRNGLFLLVLCGLLPLLITHIEPRYLSPLLIPLVLMTVQIMEWGSAQKTIVNRSAKLFAGVIAAVYVFLCAQSMPMLPNTYSGQSWLMPEQLDYLKTKTSSDQVICSDVAFAIAWQCDRTAVFLPSDAANLKIVDDIHPVAFLFVRSGEWNRSLQNYCADDWFRENFALLRRFGDGSPSAPRLYLRRGTLLTPYLSPELIHTGNDLYLREGKMIFLVSGDPPQLVEKYSSPSGVVRIKGDRKTGGMHLLTTDGQILGMAGAEDLAATPSFEGYPIDFGLTPSGRGGYILLEDGRVIAFGDAPQLQPSYLTSRPKRLLVTPSGEGFFVMQDDGAFAFAGDAQPGVPRLFGGSFASDLVQASDGVGYYILDAFGSVHPSNATIPLIAGPYDSTRKWAIDLEILDNGTPYVLTDKGEVLRFKVVEQTR